MKSKKIAVLIGSLRKESITLKTAKALISLAPKSLTFEILDISRLQHYNQDLEDSPPVAWTDFREHLSGFDGVLFVTPEYNRSVPGVLKNAIDVGSRPSGKSAWKRKPAAVVSVAPGNLSGFGANHHLRQSLVYLDMPAMQQPEAYIGGAAKLFDEKGKLINESTRDFMTKFMEAFALWVAKITVQ